MSPRAFGRAALRHAIRNHPDMLVHYPAGSRAVGSLTIAELLALAGKLGLDGQTILKTAKAAATAEGMTGTVVDDSEGSDDTEEAEAEAEGTEVSATEGPDPIDAEVSAIRDAVMRDGFSALDERLRDLVKEARKPAIVIETQVAAATPGDCSVTNAKPTGRTVTWKDAFHVTGPMAARTAQVWDGAHPSTPAVDPLYVWPDSASKLALSQLARGKNVYAFGPAGTGKTQFAEQIAARLGRPFALISCDSSTDGPTLVGMTVPAGDGVTWQDGQLTRAIQTPGCVVCIDEPSIARPGALFVMQNVLANRVLFITETGRRVPVAPGVSFICTDNTAGLGGGSRKGFTDTNRLNGAFLDRFGARIRFAYLPEAAEAGVIVARTGATLALAELLVKTATLTRAAEASDQLTNGIGLRRLLAWAEMLTDGNDVGDAFEAAILNAAPDQDQETLRQQCLLAYDAVTVADAMHPGERMHPEVSNPTPQGRRAATDFSLTAPRLFS